MKLFEPSTLRNDPLLKSVWEQLGCPPRCAITGGYVRDRLLGRRSNDLDLTIGGDAGVAGGPAQALAESLGVRAHLLGTVPHRVWRIETSSLKVELWPLGELSQEEDIRRRDFTCNALSWGLPDGPLVDLIGGIEDLERDRLRAISRSNLEGDPVRLLRAPRFLAQLEDFDLDDQTRVWVRELAPSLAEAPRERVGQELLNLLRAPGASRGVRECLDLGLLEHAAPSGIALDKDWITRHLESVSAVSTGGHTNDAAGLAFLIRSWGIPTDGRLTKYAWPQADRENALRAARLLDDAHEAVDASHADRRELAWRAGQAFPTLIALAAAIEPERPGWRRWCRQWQRNPAALEHPRPLLTGIEIAEITDIKPGPELGVVVKKLLRAQVRGEVRSRGGALKWLKARHPSRVL